MILRNVSQEREIDRMKNDFVSSVSHELRTPLTSIMAYTATILRDPNMPEQTRDKFLTIINDESNQLARLIEDILEISQIDAETVKVIHQNVDIAAAIKQVLLTLEPLADKKNIRIDSNITDKLSDFHGDESKIQSILTNLISNAIKFTPEHGRISVTAQLQDEELVVQIADTGMGIPQEELSKIFDRFYRIQRPGRQIQGTGLGLAIVKKIVAMHGGRINVESEPGQGTTFTVFLPLTSQKIPQTLAAN